MVFLFQAGKRTAFGSMEREVGAVVITLEKYAGTDRLKKTEIIV